MLSLVLLFLILAFLCFCYAALKGDSQAGYVGLALWVLSELIVRIR